MASYFDWTIPGFKSQLGDQLAMTFGESSSAVLGLNGNIVLGNKIDYIIDPLAVLSTPWQAVAPFMSMLAGRNQFINANHCDYILGQCVQIFMQGRPHFATPRLNDLGSLKTWWHAANLCSAVAMVYVEGAGQKFSTDWAKSDLDRDIGLNTAFLGALVAPAIITLLMAMWYGATEATQQMATSALAQPQVVNNPSGLNSAANGTLNPVNAANSILQSND